MDAIAQSRTLETAFATQRKGKHFRLLLVATRWEVAGHLQSSGIVVVLASVRLLFQSLAEVQHQRPRRRLTTAVAVTKAAQAVIGVRQVKTAGFMAVSLQS